MEKNSVNEAVNFFYKLAKLIQNEWQLVIFFVMCIWRVGEK